MILWYLSADVVAMISQSGTSSGHRGRKANHDRRKGSKKKCYSRTTIIQSTHQIYATWEYLYFLFRFCDVCYM